MDCLILRMDMTDEELLVWSGKLSSQLAIIRCT